MSSNATSHVLQGLHLFGNITLKVYCAQTPAPHPEMNHREHSSEYLSGHRNNMVFVSKDNMLCWIGLVFSLLLKVSRTL